MALDIYSTPPEQVLITYTIPYCTSFFSFSAAWKHCKSNTWNLLLVVFLILFAFG